MVMMIWRSDESENLRKVDLNRDYGRKEGGVAFAQTRTTEGKRSLQRCRKDENVLWIATKLRRMLRSDRSRGYLLFVSVLPSASYLGEERTYNAPTGIKIT